MLNRSIAIVCCLMLIVASVGCGGGGGGAQKSGGAASHSASQAKAAGDHASTMPPAATPAAGHAMNASVKGMVKFAGTAPKQAALKMDADPVCKGLHSTPVTAQEVVVNGNGTLRWAMVYVKGSIAGHTFPAPSTPITLDQRGCQYEPHVFGMMAGQGVKIVNSDNTLHNIHPLPKINKSFNVGMPKPGEIMKNFEAVEDPFNIKCDVHKWMSAHCAVFDHPFFAVTGTDGGFELKGLPAGTYTVVAWHEKYGTQEMSVTVGDAESKQIDFTFNAGV